MLQNIPLFSSLGEAELASLSKKVITRQFPRNTVIINEGDHSDSLYIINSGSVKVFLSDNEGKEVILRVMQLKL